MKENTVKFPFLIILGITAGLYPLLYNYNSNYTLVDSQVQLAYFIVLFIGLPIVCSTIIWLLSFKVSLIKKYVLQCLTATNLVFFTSATLFSAIGLKKKIILLGVIGATVLGFLLYKHVLKIIIIQLVLAVFVGIQLFYFMKNGLNFSTQWQELPDNIEYAKFKNTPNIYFIQPDGYVNPSVLSKPPYSYDNSVFESFLTTNDFKIYGNFRSNYTNTITSNSSVFAMKHHYYKSPTMKNKEPEGLRKSIASNNAVLKTLKNNGYTTSLMIEKPYLIVNRPKLAYDYCTIPYSDLSFLSRGFDMEVDLLTLTEQRVKNQNNSPNFYFIEKIEPGHISVRPSLALGVEKEKERYVDRLTNVNLWLPQLITFIIENDPSALIVIMADHGGYVGLESTSQRAQKVTDPTLVTSMFSTMLAVRWPDGNVPAFDKKLKTNVNLFRVLFSYLSENEVYLDHLEADKSFLILKENAPFGVYQALNEEGVLDYKIIE